MGTNTGIGIGIGIPFKNFSSGGRQPLPPDLKASLKGVWIAYGKSNNNADRSIVKNLVDPDNPFVISNAAFKLNSGFGKYEVDFTSWIQTNGVIASSDKVQNSIIGRFLYFNTVNKKEDVPSFKVNITLGQQSKLQYNYIKEDGTSTYIVYSESGIYTIPASYFSKYTGGNAWFGFYQIEGTSIIEQIPSFEGAFVTDGIDDMITSTKTVQEMLGGSNEITVISMIHYINADITDPTSSTFNNVRNASTVSGRNVLNPSDPFNKTGIYGWSRSNLNTKQDSTLIVGILGDDKDYKAINSTVISNDSKYYVEGYVIHNYIAEVSQVAWYWTFIANRVLTTDEINQVIAYYNLDRTLRPDILCNITKQGITNDNHADFNDKLIDYSGNGRDIQMNNLAWKGGSGIAAKQYETFKDWTSEFSSTSIITQIDEFTRIVESTTDGYWVSRIRRDSDLNKVYDAINVYLYQDNNFLVHECKYEVDGIKYTIPINESVGKGYHKLEIYTKDRYTELPENAENVVLSEWYFPKSTKGSIKYSIIPSCKGGILLDGINDFGKVTGMPVYKDFTVVTDREIFANIGAISSKNNPGAFVETAGNSVYSFGQATSGLNFISTRSISYLSKYSYCGQSIKAGAAEDGTDMWLGTIRDNDSRFFNGAIYSLMSFPYSMSEFLIERQLKKHKLGTLYPDMVEFRPVIKANANYKITYYQIDSTNTWKSIKVGDYIVIGAKLAFQITFDNDASELKEVVSPQLSGIIVEKRPSNPGYNIYSYITSKSPQKINITIDEYIRFEDIVQPYPVLLRFNDENGNEVSWGGKFKVGSTITRIGSAADSNLLPNIYNIFGLLLNGNQVTSSKVIVEKTMVFKAKSAYIFDNNEPKCILSPRLLRIPNSSYKILGYIPDISGHGNHGVIHNSVYAKGSGVNEDGSYQFDGVDDFVTIPTTVGGKQVLMKVNSLNSDVNVIYDQRLPTNMKGTFAIMCDNNLAYSSWNTGQTYIDGILNKNIIGNQLVNITHNLTITNDGVTNNNSKSPFIGKSTDTEKHANMSLYDFMLFDNISTEDKIKELNEYVGIEAKVELPPYYWDAYGKTNLDADKATIQQRGVAVGDYDLTNYNHAYEGMSGYNGCPIILSGTNKTYQDKASYANVVGDDKNVINLTSISFNTGVIFSYVKRDGALTSYNKDIESFKIKVTGIDLARFVIKYSYISEANATARTTMTIDSDGIYELPKSFASDGSLTPSDVWIGIYFIKQSTDIADIIEDVNVTIEVLPEYENGLVYDGITDYSKNANIPALDDFTAIIKREWLKKQGCPLIKGSKVYEGGNGNALLLEWDKAYNFVFYKRTDIMEGKLPDNISFITPTNYNGNVITRGSEQDTNGICIAGDGNAGFANMVFYKLILYPKTIPLLQINFLKNLMERDEIIDLTNPIFIKNE
mgnify:CR=1 FL=1